MKNPKQITATIEGAEYLLPTYFINENGIQDGEGHVIRFCKGDKSNPAMFRQEGYFTESLIQVAKEYLGAVNIGAMATRETSMVITKLDEALMWINKRSQDRIDRGVQATYRV